VGEPGVNRKVIRFLSRISIRLMLFNLLLVFLPVAGIIYLGSYEAKLLDAQRRALDEEARLLSAALTASGDPTELGRPILAARQQLPPPSRTEPVRLRVVATDGRVLADSGAFHQPEQLPSPARRTLLYRIGVKLAKPLLGLFKATEPALTEADYYERRERLSGEEIFAALDGSIGVEERISPDRRSVTVYVARPIWSGETVRGVALASQSTFTILQDLYTVRLGIVRIFAASVIAAIVLSFLVATTIVKPVRQLRMEAGAIIDRRGRLRGRFSGSRKHDEIGDLSRALERLTSRLDEHVRFIESFAADVSHEFKNPLASIRTATEMLAEVDEPAQRKRFLRMVERDIARMESLLSGVREISMIDAQLAGEMRDRVDVAAMMARIVEGFQLREKDNVTIVLDVPETPCIVEASEDRLIQVFVNVLENAISFSPAGGTVTITVAATGRRVATTIADQGPGIPETNLSRVFDRFFTHRPDTSRARTSHTGLGLAIVKAVVEGYGGSVSAANGVEGGARFEIRLPAA
jgi:two-component system sensor histidine kinase ChvG